MKHTLDDFRKLTDEQICRFFAGMADSCSYPDGGDCTLCPMHLYFGVEGCNAEKLIQEISGKKKPEPIELVLPKEYVENTEQIIKNQCPNCKHADFLPFTSQPNCGCDEMKIRASEWFYAVQKEPKCIFFERANPAYEIFKAVNGINEKE